MIWAILIFAILHFIFRPRADWDFENGQLIVHYTWNKQRRTLIVK